MKKLKIYLDTSVISAYFDFKKPVRQLITQKWFENEIQRYDTYISDVVVQEIQNTKDTELRTNFVKLIDDISPTLMPITDFEDELAIKYRAAILKKEINDTLHIASASLARLNAIVSWNFHHIVNLETMNAINDINLIENLNMIEIVSPENLGGSKYGSL